MNKFNVSDLIDRKLVRAKEYPSGLKVLKYTKKVFWDNLWHLDDRLLNCRGTVVDSDWNIITMPFTKVFNYGENNTFVDRDRIVVAPEKVNGFMAAMNSDYTPLVSTTGTLDSDFVTMAIEKIKPSRLITNHTFLFEIVHENDPHIVNETPGAYLIGVRHNHLNSDMFDESVLDDIAEQEGWLRPKWSQKRFGEVLDGAGYVYHEGYMIRDAVSGDILCKLKSPYYLAKKFFMRVSKNTLKSLFDNPEMFKKRIDEEYYPLLQYITDDFRKKDWESLDESQRGDIVEDFIYHMKRGGV